MDACVVHLLSIYPHLESSYRCPFCLCLEALRFKLQVSLASKFVPLNSLHPLPGGFIFTMSLQARPSLPHHDAFKPLQRAFLHIAVSPKPTSSLYQKTDDRCSRLFSHPNSNGLAFSWATLINSEVSACADASLMVSTHDGAVRRVSDAGRSPLSRLLFLYVPTLRCYLLGCCGSRIGSYLRTCVPVAEVQNVHHLLVDFSSDSFQDNMGFPLYDDINLRVVRVSLCQLG